jgi:hypothetical protein
LLGELETAIRTEYAAKIAELESERDGKIAAVHSLGSVFGNGHARKAKTARPAKALKRPAREAEPVARKKSADPDEAPSFGKRIQHAALERTENFTIDDVLAADPEFVDKKSLVYYHLKNLVARGELRLQKGGNNKPNVYTPMPINSVRRPPGPPSRAARSSRTLSGPAAASA